MSGRRLHVGVDAWNLLGDRRGIGRYARAMLREWVTTFKDDVEITLLVPEWPAWWHAGAYRRESGGWPFRVRGRAAAKSSAIDVLWFPWNGISWSAPRPKVATLHDASLFALDLAPQKRERETIPFQRAVREGARLVTDSNFSRSELARYLAIDPLSIEVVPLGVEPPAQPSKRAPSLPFHLPYVLFVGEFEKRKGLDVLLDAIALLPAGLRSRIGLVLAGETGRTARVATDVPIAILGHVDDAELSALYQSAGAFVYPSRYEGFGLPVLEAMAHGAPVIASNAGGIPEAGGDAARYFQSGDSAELSRALIDVLENQSFADELRQSGKARASDMSWRSTAAKTLQILYSVSDETVQRFKAQGSLSN